MRNPTVLKWLALPRSFKEMFQTQPSKNVKVQRKKRIGEAVGGGGALVINFKQLGGVSELT